MIKKIAFHTNQLSLRGTEVAIFQYAKYNEDILKNKSVIFTFPNRDISAYEKFKERFEVIILDWHNYEKYLVDNNFDYLYVIKMGNKDGYCLSTVPTLVHSVFRFNEPHGYKYFYVSDWLAKDQGYNPETHSLPHICERLPQSEYNFREKHKIPEDVRVFGCYGGSTEFNIESTKSAIHKVVQEYNDIYFIFMNIQEFADHPQIKFFPGNYDLKEKSAFVDACDAMIHARTGGETFGLAVSEFALSNKPIITYELSEERSHLDILGERAILYKGYEDLLDIFVNFPLYVKYTDYDLPYKQFSPENVIKKFNKFLN